MNFDCKINLNITYLVPYWTPRTVEKRDTANCSVEVLGLALAMKMCPYRLRVLIKGQKQWGVLVENNIAFTIFLNEPVPRTSFKACLSVFSIAQIFEEMTA